MPAELLSFNSEDPEEGEASRDAGYATFTSELSGDEVLELCRDEFGGDIFDFSYYPLTEASQMTEAEQLLFASNGSLARFTYITKSES